MEVVLDDEEATALRQVLRTYLSDLRMEIGATDDHHFRDGLKAERSVLEGVLAKLGPTEDEVLPPGEAREVVGVVSLVWSEQRWIEST